MAEDVTEEPAGAGTPEAVKAVDAAAAADPVESVDIPKQQSAEEAADNEAGEGARK
ncbi:gliding motility protein [Streptomyces sp. NPDC101115]|uniref:gliding motility protein n=1 Tax=Streptomyces sp. NPDC101115 TaxID=3366106 RepID=UPI0038200DB6